MKSRIASVFTVAALLGGTGGAIALAGSGSSHGPNGGAAKGEYNEGKGCGDKHANHHHLRHDECKKHHGPSDKGGKGDHGKSGGDKGEPSKGDNKSSKGDSSSKGNSTATSNSNRSTQSNNSSQSTNTKPNTPTPPTTTSGNGNSSKGDSKGKK